jgi:hypothetical protein
MEKVVAGTAFLLKVGPNIVDLNRGQFVLAAPTVMRRNYPTHH